MRNNNGSCVLGNCAFVGEWSFIAVDIELNVSNKDVSNNGINDGRQWQLVVEDGCKNGNLASERLRFRFTDKHSNKGQIDLIQRNLDGTEAPPDNIGEYIHGEWFRLRIVFDNTAGFEIVDGDCISDGGRIGGTVKLYLQRHAPTADCYIYHKNVHNETDWLVAPIRDPLAVPGIRIRIEGEKHDGPALWLGALGVRPTDGCEFFKFGSDGNTNMNWPCDSPDTPEGACGCTTSGWACQPPACECNKWSDCQDESDQCSP